MTEPLSPIARQLLGDSDEPDRNVPCFICGASTPCPGFIVAAVKTWNEQHRDTERPIRPSELGVCCEGECTRILFERKHREVQEENAQTDALLKMLFVGKYNAESLAWLRKHGCAKQVERVLNEEGTRRAANNQSEAKPKTTPATPYPAQRSFDDEISYGDK